MQLRWKNGAGEEAMERGSERKGPFWGPIAGHPCLVSYRLPITEHIAATASRMYNGLAAEVLCARR
jgi:hypothetical protein